MRPLECRLRTVIQIPLDANDEQERLLMEETDIRTKDAIEWDDGFLFDIQPVTRKFISNDYQNEQTVFFGMVWNHRDGQIKALPLSEIIVEGKEMDRMIRKEWN